MANGMNVANKTVLITGANRGSSRALVDEALKRGAKGFMPLLPCRCRRLRSREAGHRGAVKGMERQFAGFVQAVAVSTA